MLQSPFPGMDPYLEQDWLDVHSRLIYLICGQLQSQLPRDLCARMESRIVVDDQFEWDPRDRHPDVRVVESKQSHGGAALLEALPAAAIEPDLLLVKLRTEPANQRFVEIVDAQTRKRVITTIELVSPSNKRSGHTQDQYLQKREECLAAGVNFVEIDLTRAGNRLSILPELSSVHPEPTYLGCVRRGTNPDEMALYLMPLDRPLRPMRIPLRPKDEDVVLQLQPLVAQAYDGGRYDTLDYRRPLDPPLTGAEAEFAKAVLQAVGKA